MLTEYTTPGESIEIRDDQTIYSLLTDRLARTGAATVIAAKQIGPGRWQNVTTGEFHERVVSAAKGLIALGITKGDRSLSSPPPALNGASSTSRWLQWAR